MTVYYSKGGSSGSPLDFQTVGNWNDQTDGGGSDASTLVGHDLIIQNGDYMTLGATVTTDSLDVLAGGHLAANNSYQLQLAGADGGNDIILINGELDDENLNVVITRSGSGNIDLNASNSNNIRRLTYSHGGFAGTLVTECTISENLYATNGTLSTRRPSDDADQNLTVEGAVVIATDGVLTCNSSQVTFGSLEIAGGIYNATSGITLINGAAPGAYTWKNSSGTFNHNGGTVDIRFTGTDGVHLKENTFYNYTQTLATGSYANARVNWRPSSGTEVTILNDMTIEEGYFRPNTASHTLNVLGDCVIVTPSVASGIGYGASTYTGNWRFGSLTVQTGAQYLATGGTTTITGGLRPGDIAGTFDLQPGTQKGAVELGGTGGFFEGDFLKDAREVRINQDFALDFPGTDEYISIPDHDDFSFGSGTADSDVPFSLSAWIYMDADPFPIISKGGYNQGDGEYAFLVSGSGYLALELYDESVSSCYLGKQYQTAIPLGSWAHVAATYDATEASSGIELYVNGVQVTAALYQGNEGSYVAMENLGHTLMIGEAKGPSYANGKISDVRVYDSVLSAANVAKLASKMHVGLGSPIGWWKLNESTIDDVSAGSVLDSSKNTHHGQCVGWNDAAAVIASQDYTTFGLDIQAPETTTGATVAATTVSNLIVESGQLNMKSSTSYNFTDTGGSNFFTDARPHTEDLSVKPITIASWVRPDTSIPMYIGGLTAANNDSKYSLGFGFDEDRADAMGLGVTFSSTETPDYDTTVKNCGVDASALISLNEWVHLAMTYNGGGFTTVGNYDFYVNGVLVTTSKAVDTDVDLYRVTPGSGGNKVVIGKGGNPMKGDQRDIRIYDYALSADQIASLYRGSFNISPNVAWYKLDEGTGDPVDSSTAGLGTASGAHAGGTWTTTGSLKVNGAARVLDNGSVS